MSETINQDSIALQEAMVGAARSFTGNSAMGFGTGRSPLSYNQVMRSGDLDDLSAMLLYEGSHLIQKITYLYPLEGAQHWLKFTAKSDEESQEFDADLQEYLNSKSGDPDTPPELSLSRLSDLFFDASFNARLFGRAYILIGVDDGGEWWEPIDPKTIRSLRRLEVVYHWEIYPEYKVGKRYSKPQYYRLNSIFRPEDNSDLKVNGLIHASRVLRFDGVMLPERSQMLRLNRGKSVIDGVWKALARAEISFEAAAYMLQTSSMFTYGLNGLSEIKDETVRKAIMARLQTVMFSMSVLKGLPYDSQTEKLDILARQFGGVDKILAAILDQVSIECDVPRSKLFELSEASGLNSVGKGESERFMWSQALDGWRDRNWVSPFLYLGRIALLARDYTKGKKLDGLGVAIPDSLQLTPGEKLDMREQHIQTMDTAIAAGMLTPWEARKSTYGGQQWGYEITLDDRVSKRMEDEIENPIPTEQQALPGQDPAADPSVQNPEIQSPSEGPGDWEQIDRADDGTKAQRKIQWQGFTIGLQYRTGDVRHNRKILASYGYFEKTRGADGMAIDVYLGGDLTLPNIYEIEQVINGKFDEHKYVIGVDSIEAAKRIYTSAMPPEFMGAVRQVTLATIEGQRI